MSFLALYAILHLTERAYACSCVPCSEIFADGSFVETSEVNVVFVGRVKSMKVVTEELGFFDRILNVQSWVASGSDHKEIEFDKLILAKGPKEATYRVRTPLIKAGCGAGFFLGATQRVAGIILPSGLIETDSCIQRCWESDVNDDIFGDIMTDDKRWLEMNE